MEAKPEPPIQRKLLDFARTTCLPHLLADSRIAHWSDQIAFLLVGSVATGLCRDDSDVDIALLCDGEVFDKLSAGTLWANGRPSETSIDGIQLHHYGIPFEQVAHRIRELDDAYLYVYSHAIVLKDSNSGHAKRLCELMPDRHVLRKERVEGKLDMLLRRSGALRGIVKQGDPVVSVRVFLEVITLALKVISLLDDVPCDPRKRFFKTALSGPLGRQLAPRVRAVFGQLGVLETFDDPQWPASVLPQELAAIADVLAATARTQGLAVGLEAPDRRHLEA